MPDHFKFAKACFNSTEFLVYFPDKLTYEKRSIQQTEQRRYLPNDCATAVTPMGDIFLIGGVKGNEYTNKVYYVEMPSTQQERANLIDSAPMIDKRSLMGVCCTDDEIIVVGGFTFDKVLMECELFNI